MDFYGVPNLPGVQAGVSSGQIPHLSGANNDSGDGFGQGFNAVMNMEKLLSDKEWTKLIKQNTDANVHIDYAKVNAAAAKDDAIKFGADHWDPIISSEQAKQLERAATVQSQRADIQAAYFRHLISQDEARKALQNAAEKSQSSAVNPEAGSVIDAGRYMQDVEQTQPHLVATTDSGQQITGQGLPIGKSTTSPMFVVNKTLSPEATAHAESHAIDVTTQDPITKTNLKQTDTPVFDSKGHLIGLIPRVTDNSQENVESKQYNDLVSTNPTAIPQLQNQIRTGNEGIETAVKAINNPESTGYMASLANKIFGGVKDWNSLSPQALQKILANANMSQNPHSVEALREIIRSNGGNAPAAITALAQFINGRKPYEELINRNMAKALGDVNHYRTALKKWGVNFPDLADYYHFMALSPQARKIVQTGLNAYDSTFVNRMRNAAQTLDSVDSAAQKEKDPRFKAFDSDMQGSNR